MQFNVFQMYSNSLWLFFEIHMQYLKAYVMYTQTVQYSKDLTEMQRILINV